MPDFPQLEYSDWLDTITLALTISGLLLGFIYTQILQSPTTRQSFIQVLEASKVRRLYQAGVLWLLKFLQRVYGAKNSLKALNFSILLAYLYPILFFIFSYSHLGGANYFSDIEILPDELGFRPLFFAVFVLISVIFSLSLIYRQFFAKNSIWFFIAALLFFCFHIYSYSRFCLF